jgi:hypothetical protein
MDEDAIEAANMRKLGYTMPEGRMLSRAEAFLSETVPLWRRAPASRREVLLLSTHRGLLASDAAVASAA